MKRAFLLLVVIVCFPAIGRAACSGSSPTWTAASASDADINACITVASSGDTILVPAGTVSFSAAVTIAAAKCLTINGQNAVTVTSQTNFIINASATCESRVTGFNFTGGSSGTATNITLNGNAFASRIDHNTFTATGTQIFLIIVDIGSSGQSWPALVDHNTFNCGYVTGSACEAIHVVGNNNEPVQIGWTNNVVPGSANMVFIEDNTFNQTGGNGGNQISAVEQFYGSQTVIRHNTTNNCAQYDAHGSNLTGARWWEIYDNQFTHNSFSCPTDMQLRGGTGVVWGNVSDGTSTNSTPCSPACFIDIFNESGSSATWPNTWQVGSGINGNTASHASCPGPTNNAPIQIWGNTNLPVGVGGGQSGTVLLNRDYFLPASQPATIHWEEASGDTCSTTYSYVPYTYPHPLVGPAFPSASSTIDWTHAGIPGGIPDAAWPICQTIPPSGGADDSVTIQNALNSCPSGSVVLLTAGTYTLHRTTGVVCPGKSDDGGGGVYESGLCVTDKSIVLRGAGPQSTVIKYGDGANIISMGQTFLSHTGVTFTAITSGASKGSTSITVGTLPAGVVVNSFIVISQTNPLDSDGNPLVQIGGYGGSCSYCGHDLPNNAMDQIDEVIGISGTTMTLARPLYWTYTNAPVMYHLPMVQSAGVENLRVVGTVASGTSLQYKNVNMEACAFCWIHNVESDFAVDLSNFYGSDVYAGEISNNYAYEGFNHNAGADYSLFLQFRASEMLVQNNIIRRARHSTPVQGTAGNVFIYNYLLNAYEGENHNFLPETQLHAPEPYMNLWEGNVMSNSEYGDNAHGSSNDNTFFRNYVNLTAIDPDNGLPMTGGIIAMNTAYYSNYQNIVGNVFGQYPTGCTASTYETDASTTKVNGVIWQLGYFDDGGGSTPNQTLSNKVGQTLIRGGNWDCVTNSVVWSGNIPVGSPSQSSYIPTQTLPSSLVFSSAPSYFASTGAVWPPINTTSSTIVNQIPAQICYNASGGPSTSAGGNFNPTACYTSTLTPTFNYPADDYGGLLSVPCPANPHAVTITSASQTGTVQTVVVSSVANFGVNESMLISGTGTAMDWTYTANNATDGTSYITAINYGTNTLTLTAAASHTVSGVTSGTITPGKLYIQTISTTFGNGPQFCTPEKHWLWLTVVGAAGGATYQGTGAVSINFATKYGSACAGAQALQTEFVNTLNFNTIGPDPDSTYFLNGACTSNTRLDTFTDVGVSQYSGVNLGGYVSQPLIDMNAAVDNFYNANGGINAPMVDYFNPNWNLFLSQFITKFSNNLTQFYRTPHFLGTPGDDTDFTKLPDAGGDFHTIPISHQSVDPAMQVLVTSPLMTLEAVPTANIYGGGQATPYVFTDPLNYSKTPVASPPAVCNVATFCDLPDFLRGEYTTVSALNTAWSTSGFYTTFGSSGTCFGYTYSWCGANSAAGTFVGTGVTTYTPTLNTVTAPHSLQILLNGVPIGGDCPFFSALPGMGCSGASGTGNILGPGIWKASLAFPAGFTRTDSNGNIEIATVGGTSGASVPAWPATCTGTQTTTDGTGTWKCLGPGIANTSKITYATGVTSIAFNSALTASNTITLKYMTNGWGTGTGLLDEDGRNTGWIGTNYVCLIQPPAFATTHAYTVNQEIHDATSGTWQIVTAGGTSGGSAPAFSATQGTTTTTGTVTFTSMGLPVCGTETGSDFGAINANQTFGADMETWLIQEAGAYFGGIQAAFHTNYPDLLYGGADAVGVWASVPRAAILIAAQQYSDWIYTASFSAPNIDLNAYAKNSFQTQYYHKPMVTYHTLASTQSIYGCDGNPGPTICFSTQAAKGNQYFLNTQAQLNSALSFNGTFQWAGMQWWGSHPFQSSDFGFNTSLDNLYDGNDNVNASVPCSSPLAAYTCGGETSGASWLGTNLTTSIAAANLLWTKGSLLPAPAISIFAEEVP